MTFDITVKKVEQPPTEKFNPRMWYRLRNTYQPSTHCLDVINDNGTDSEGLIQMAVTGKFSGQYWQLKANENGSYCLRTMFLGPERQLGVKDDKKTPILQAANPAARAQYWTIEPWGSPQDGTWHLEVGYLHPCACHLLTHHVQNAWTEQSRYLDTMEGGRKVEMNQANNGRPTQRWTIEPIREMTESGF